MKKLTLGVGNRQKGLAVVEATIVLPILLLLLLAIGEFGRVIYQYHILTKSVRAGTHHLLPENFMNEFEREILEEKVKNIVVYGHDSGQGITVLPGFTKDDVSVTIIEIPEGSTYQYMVIDAQYDWVPIFGEGFNTFFGSVIDLSFPLSTSITSRVLTY